MTRLLTIVAACLLSLCAAAQRKPTVIVEAIPGGERVTLADGRVIDKNKWGTGPLTHGIAAAVRASENGEVYGLKGDLRGVVFGSGDVNKPDVCFAPGNEPIKALFVDADGNLDTRPSINGVTIGDSLGGIDVLTLHGLTLTCEGYSSSMVSCVQGANTGRLRLLACWLEPKDPAAWHGHGSKWPIRTHGHLNGVDGALSAYYLGVEHIGDGEGGGIEVVDCVIWPGEEHAYWYLDNVGPSIIRGVRCHPGYDRSLWVQRTLGQITNRANPAGVTAGGPSGYGRIEISDVESVQCGGDPAFGGNGDGFAITVAGHLGQVQISDLDLSGFHGGGITVWTDANPIKGVWTFADGHSSAKVTLANVKLASTINTNPLVSIGGARSVVVARDFVFAGRNVAIDVDNDYAGPIATGALSFDVGPNPSQHAGWQAAAKVRRNEVVLTDAQVDALAVVDGSAKP